MLKTIKALPLTFSNIRTYLLASLFVLGNIVLPQLCHLIPQGGIMFQPIYAFTLIAACFFGWRVALLTAVVSPLANYLLFAMPSAAMLPVVWIKSVVLALCVSKAAVCRSEWRMPLLVLSIVGTQVVGFAAEWTILGALPSFLISLPGVVLQIVLALWVAARRR